jgi:electron transfer flavoprotein alpha subunit
MGETLSAVLLSGEAIEPDELFYHGAEKVYRLAGEAFAEPLEIPYKEAIVELSRQVEPKALLIGATNFGRSLAPRIAMKLEAGLTADCVDLDVDEDGDLIQIRPAFSGNILAHIKTRSSPQMTTVRYKEMEPAARDETAQGKVVEIDFDPDSVALDGLEILEERRKEKVNLEDAEVVVSGGRGLKQSGDFELLEELADLLGAEIGASRPLVDEGWIDREHQVGYSGRRVKPRTYIACGISGQSQHLAGMKESDTIIAINNDPSAPIFEYADYGVVGDLYEVVPELIRQLKGGSQ